MAHLTLDALEAALDDIRRAPKDDGVVELIVRRPGVDEREELAEATLDPADGLVGDGWKARGSGTDRQLTLMNARVVSLLARTEDRRQLAGDQLYVDFDLSLDNIPPGTRVAIGDAVVAVSAAPHRGCKKFAARFGQDAWTFVNSEVGKQLNLRGINATVVVGGTVRPGDPIRKAP